MKVGGALLWGNQVAQENPRLDSYAIEEFCDSDLNYSMY